MAVEGGAMSLEPNTSKDSTTENNNETDNNPEFIDLTQDESLVIVDEGDNTQCIDVITLDDTIQPLNRRSQCGSTSTRNNHNEVLVLSDSNSDSDIELEEQSIRKYARISNTARLPVTAKIPSIRPLIRRQHYQSPSAVPAPLETILPKNSHPNPSTAQVQMPSVNSLHRTPPPPLSPPNALKCPICIETFVVIKERGLKVVVTRCGHIFCDFCVKKAISDNGRKCPKCRKSIPKGPTGIIEIFDVC